MQTSAQGVHRGGSGEPMLLIHGFSATRAAWQPVLTELESTHDVLAVNLAGHAGGPDFPAGTRVCVEGLLDMVEHDMDAAGFETAHIVGNSLGGWIALELAARGRARSVVAVAPAGGWEAGSGAERRLRKLFKRNHRLASALLPRLDSLVTRPRLRHILLRDMVAHGERVPPAAAAQIVRDSVGCSVYFELMDAILGDGPPQSFAGVDCPVLLVWGTRDRILPAPRYSERLRELLPDSTWVELRGLGHVPMSDDPALVARTITQFAASASERAPIAAA